ncbi:hypothetical protein ND748_16815 [Frankia sp. AiPs1]|uniref:hypothetical protein n=1 Tax=Frankia sp. AiPs1 TaxID=573493 RepID=UPI002043F913|nr:hypothetical protein [Frankia sp. AiPs1]MCM3923315.1 hypothetical protein [Frankia sp. AiPs1]
MTATSVTAGSVTAGPVSVTSASAGSVSAGPGPLPRVRPPGAPGIGSIFVLAFLVILVPGVAVYVLLDWAGLPIGGASLLGLLVVFLGLGFFPTVLRRLGWVPTKKRRS